MYRYGFNGKERDQSFGNVHYDYGFRIYNPEIGKFLSVDPLSPQYPMLSSYQYASNNPILNVDIDGLEGLEYLHVMQTHETQMAKKTPEERKRIQNQGGLVFLGITGLVGVMVVAPEAMPFIVEGGYTTLAAAAPYATTATLLAGRYGPEAIGFAAGALGYDAEIPGASGDEVGKLVNKGLKLGAAKFYRSFAKYAQYTDEAIGDRLLGINFDKDVFETVLEKGSKVVQYVDDVTGKVGNYFAPVGTDAATLGINTEGRTGKIFTLTEDVRVLQSTAADFQDKATKEIYKGGGTQYFSPELSQSVKPVVE